MRVVTWNVNSLRARMERVAELAEGYRPDVVLLQETKCSAEQFPRDDLAALGYNATECSSGRWTGVAILAREGLTIEDPVDDLPDNPVPEEARWVEATVGGVRFASVYVVNGRTVDHEQYELKLQFLGAMARRAEAFAEAGTPAVIGGDMNVCPRDVDVWDIRAMEGATHVTPAERAALAAVLEAGDMVDAHVHVHGPDAQQFTWWDYRGGSFHKNLGLRIDHHLVSNSLAPAIREVGILRDLRKGTKPSDHAPLELVLEH